MDNLSLLPIGRHAGGNAFLEYSVYLQYFLAKHWDCVSSDSKKSKKTHVHLQRRKYMCVISSWLIIPGKKYLANALGLLQALTMGVARA